MAQPEKSLRLVHAPESFCDVMVRANIALVNDRPEKAIHLYTEVLYKLSPAHVCAFLNRSMAYIQDGYYELAVTDAYRACITASELRKVLVPSLNYSFFILQLELHGSERGRVSSSSMLKGLVEYISCNRMSFFPLPCS